MSAERDFEVFYTHWRAAVISIAHRRGDSDPEDAAQETFTRMWARWGGIPSDARERKAYLFATVGNLCIDRARGRTIRPTPFPLDAAEDVAAPPPSSDSLHGFMKLLLPLSPRQRQVLFLRYAADQSVDTIASTLGIARGSVGAKQNQALERLRGLQ